MKTVFNDISNVAHLFANQSQSEAKYKGGNFFFYDNVIYSYGHHFPIAAHYTTKKGERVLIFTLDKYSHTTSKHIWTVEAATSHLRKIYCRYILDAKEGRHQSNLSHFDFLAEKALKKLEKATKPEIYLSELDRIKTLLENYVETFGVKKSDLKPLLFVTKEVATKGDGKALIAKKIELEKKAEQERERELKKKRLLDISKFRAFESHSFYNPLNGNETLLRVNGGNVETSKGIKFPLEVAKRFLKTLERVRENGIPEQGITFLDYPLRECSKDSIQIGCHSITWEEIKETAKQFT